jgi:hypothetical protein
MIPSSVVGNGQRRTSNRRGVNRIYSSAKLRNQSVDGTPRSINQLDRPDDLLVTAVQGGRHLVDRA